MFYSSVWFLGLCFNVWPGKLSINGQSLVHDDTEQRGESRADILQFHMETSLEVIHPCYFPLHNCLAARLHLPAPCRNHNSINLVQPCIISIRILLNPHFQKTYRGRQASLENGNCPKIKLYLSWSSCNLSPRWHWVVYKYTEEGTFFLLIKNHRLHHSRRIASLADQMTHYPSFESTSYGINSNPMQGIASLQIGQPIRLTMKVLGRFSRVIEKYILLNLFLIPIDSLSNSIVKSLQCPSTVWEILRRIFQCTTAAGNHALLTQLLCIRLSKL